MNLIPRSFFFDDDFDDFFLSNPKRNDMKCDIYEENNEYHIDIDVPGFKKEDINIEVKDGYLTVSAKKEHEDKETKKNYIRRERSCGVYQRSFALGDVDIDKIDAEFNHGTLSIVVPKQENIEHKKTIEIK